VFYFANGFFLCSARISDPAIPATAGLLPTRNPIHYASRLHGSAFLFSSIKRRPGALRCTPKTHPIETLFYFANKFFLIPNSTCPCLCSLSFLLFVFIFLRVETGSEIRPFAAR
jgi:hypothetical protein